MATLTTGQRLKIARTEARLTQPQLSDLTGIAQANISRYENGQLAPNARTVDKIIGAIEQYMRDQGKELTTLAAVDGTLGIVGRTAGKLVPIGSLMEQTEPIDWIVENYLARGYVTMLAGQAGAGKSMHCQTLAAALANGADEACGLKLPGKQMRGLVIDAENVMVVDGEARANLAKSRMQQAGITDANEHLVTVLGAAGFDIEKDHDALNAAIADMQATDEPIDYVIFDSWKTLWVGAESAPEAVTRCLNLINGLAARHNIGVILIHHADKGGDTYRGSSAIAATVAAVYTFAKVAEAGSTDEDDEEQGTRQHSRVRRLHAVKCRIAPEMDDVYSFVSGHGMLGSPCDCEQCEPRREGEE